MLVTIVGARVQKEVISPRSHAHLSLIGQSGGALAAHLFLIGQAEPRPRKGVLLSMILLAERFICYLKTRISFSDAKLAMREHVIGILPISPPQSPSKSSHVSQPLICVRQGGDRGKTR